jgi:DNA-binding Lrp family transcriptional regulator
MIDKKDQIILMELKKNARKPIKAISTSTGIPRVTIHDRIKRMVKRGVIKSFTVVPDYTKINLPITAFVLVSFLPNPDVSQRELAKRIAQMKGVYEVHIISGEYDLLLKVRGKSIDEIGKLIVDRLRRLRGVGKTITCTCFTTVKEEL